MQTRHLKYVIEIAQWGSITKAAARLWMSQQALSRILENIEQELGFKIFERTNKGVVATAKGEEFLSDLISVMSIMSKWEVRRGEKQKVNILLQYVLSDLILDEKFLKRVIADEGIDIQWETMYPPDIVKRMKTGEPCWGIFIASPQARIYYELEKLKNSSKTKIEKIADNKIAKMTILLRKDDPLMAKSSIGCNDLKGKIFAINQGILMTEIPQILSRYTKTDTAVLPISVNAVEFITQKANTFTCLPYFLASNNAHVKNGDVVIRQLEENLDKDLSCYLLYNSDQKIKMQSIVKNMRQYFEESAIGV